MNEGAITDEIAAVRVLLSRHLVGAGVELGPGDKPFPLPFPGVEVKYVDRWEPGENRELFPELGPSASFPKPDYVCNLDTDRLKALGDESQDFVIASHVLEHVAEPIGLLDDIHRVLRPGGVVIILLPDRRRTFDRDRTPTTLDHVVAEFEAGVTEVDDDHVFEFVEKTETPEKFRKHVVEASPEQRNALFDAHRRRSLHVHCWSEDEFLPVLDYGVRELRHMWEFIDGVVSDDEGPEGFEFGYVLRRSTIELPPHVVADRLTVTIEAFVKQRRQVHKALETVRQRDAAASSSPPPARLRRLRQALDDSTRRSLERRPVVYQAARRVLHAGRVVCDAALGRRRSTVEGD